MPASVAAVTYGKQLRTASQMIFWVLSFSFVGLPFGIAQPLCLSGQYMRIITPSSKQGLLRAGLLDTMG